MVKQGTKEWFDARAGRVTGSSAGAALGVNPWRTSSDVVRDMVRSLHGAEKEFRGNPATFYGQTHEPLAVLDYMSETGLDVDECGFFEFENWLGASPDGLVGEDGLIEIKCPYSQRDKEKPEFKTALDQPYYYAQMQVQMFCSGRSWTDFYQWSPAGTRLERVARDEQWLAENMPKLRAFYDHFLTEISNPEHLEPKRSKSRDNKAADLIAEYDRIGREIDEANERKKEILDEIVSLAGGKDVDFMMPDGETTRKLTLVRRKGSVSYSRIVKDHLTGVDLEPYTGEGTEYWRLS